MTSADVKRAITITHEYYRRGGGAPLPGEVLSIYAQDLSHLDPRLVVEAYARYRGNPANRQPPLPADIIALVDPESFVAPEVKAREVAGRIVGAVARFGWNHPKEAQIFIGPEGWALIQRQGGWMYLCENLGVNLNPATVQAQLRDQLVGIFRYGTTAIQKSISGELTAAGEILKLIPSQEKQP